MGLALEELWVQPLGELHAMNEWSLKNIVKEGMGVQGIYNIRIKRDSVMYRT